MIEKPQQASEQIYTAANVITVARLLLVPFAFSVLIGGKNDTLAFILFAVAALSDFVDGQLARRTNTVTEIGKVIDPLVDRFLIAAGVIGLYVVGRLPLWILVLLIGRDVFLLFGSSRLNKREVGRIDIIFAGKATTAVLLAGFSGLIINTPIIQSPSLINAPWLPGFNGAPVCVWIYLVYGGILLSLWTAIRYVQLAFFAIKVAQRD